MPSHISIIFHRKVLQILQQLPFSKHEWGVAQGGKSCDVRGRTDKWHAHGTSFHTFRNGLSLLLR